MDRWHGGELELSKQSLGARPREADLRARDRRSEVRPIEAATGSPDGVPRSLPGGKPPSSSKQPRVDCFSSSVHLVRTDSPQGTVSQKPPPRAPRRMSARRKECFRAPPWDPLAAEFWNALPRTVTREDSPTLAWGQQKQRFQVRDEKGCPTPPIAKRRRVARKLRVALLGHQFQVPSEGQAKAAALARVFDGELLVLTPDRYREAEVRWRVPVAPPAARAEPAEGGYRFAVEKVRWPWTGPCKWYLQWYPHLAKRLRAFQPDVVDVWEEPWNLLSAQVAWIRRHWLPQTRLVFETEQNLSKVLPPPFEALRAYTLREADFLIGRNRQALQVARSKGYLGPTRVVGNGVCTSLFSPRNRAQCRAKWGMDGFAVGYAGRLVEAKGITDLVQSVLGMPEDTRLWVCGEGPLEATFRSFAPRIHCVGSLARETLGDFLGALDVLVLPSRTTKSWMEQFGRVLVEAQACETPVVGSSSGAIPEVIQDAGCVFPEGDVTALRGVLSALRLDPALRQRLGKAGRQRVLEWYSWASIAHQMREVYEACW